MDKKRKVVVKKGGHMPRKMGRGGSLGVRKYKNSQYPGLDKTTHKYLRAGKNGTSAFLLALVFFTPFALVSTFSLSLGIKKSETKGYLLVFMLYLRTDFKKICFGLKSIVKFNITFF